MLIINDAFVSNFWSEIWLLILSVDRRQQVFSFKRIDFFSYKRVYKSFLKRLKMFLCCLKKRPLKRKKLPNDKIKPPINTVFTVESNQIKAVYMRTLSLVEATRCWYMYILLILKNLMWFIVRICNINDNSSWTDCSIRHNPVHKIFHILLYIAV